MYRITVKKFEMVEQPREYHPEQTEVVEKGEPIFIQVVDELDIKAVIDAINKGAK